MLKNYLIITLRRISRDKVNAFIKIAGLAGGMAVFVLVMLYVHFELSYDKFHRNYHRIYKVEQDVEYAAGSVRMTITPGPVGPATVNHIRGIRTYVRIAPVGSLLIASPDNNKKFNENRGFYVDDSFFDIFTFPMIKGDAKTSLSNPLSMVLTEKAAEKYFPHEEPLGKILRLEKRFDGKVTGIIKNPPANSYFQFDFLVSFSSYPIVEQRGVVESWGVTRFHTYVLLEPHQDPERIAASIRDLPQKYMGENSLAQLYLKPFARCHLDDIQYSEGETAKIEVIFLFFLIALVVLVIACINFMNLTTANATDREKEVKTRKAVGADRKSLIFQFLMESLLIAFFAAAAALPLVILLLPGFNHLLDKQLTMSMLTDGIFPLGALAVILLVGLLSGGYPAFYLSALRPVKVTGGSSKIGKASPFIRKVLVIFQLFISIVLIFLSLTIYRQGNHLKQVDQGFQSRDLLVYMFNNQKSESIDQYETFKNELLKNSNILSASISDDLPGIIGSSTRITGEGGSRADTLMCYDTHIDESFISTFGLELREGRNFSSQFPADRYYSCIVNESAVNLLGLRQSAHPGQDSPIGKEISAFNRKLTIIGVVKDFTLMGFEPVKALMMRPHEERLAKKIFLTLKIVPGSREAVLDFIKPKFAAFFPEDIFDFRAYEDLPFIRRFFERVDNLLTLIASISSVAAFIAILGLFSMASYSTRRRWKEIGVRKVFGASTTKILGLLGKEYLVILVIANLAAWPVAYLLANGILQDSAYRTTIHWWFFPAVGLISLAVGLSTVASQTLKAARTNPVETLRCE
jgi:putative ABC transport system permease protein